MDYDHLIMMGMLILNGYLAYLGTRLSWLASQAAKEGAEKAREHEQLISATLEGAREILRRTQNR
ncbi:MAG: hypothetical protein ACRERD_28200 [Candidatus Binatia bacterium]